MAAVVTATRMERPELRAVLKEAFKSIWRIDGQPGIYQYVKGCKKDYQPKADEVVAEVNGQPVIFIKDDATMLAFKEALA